MFLVTKQPVTECLLYYGNFLFQLKPEQIRLGNKLLVYISCCLAGRAYPYGDIDKEKVTYFIASHYDIKQLVQLFPGMVSYSYSDWSRGGRAKDSVGVVINLLIIGIGKWGEKGK